ncbi:MAG: dTDP-4-dehydrorhamnose reductase [Alphaproteobacteria bacterium]|nr:dTDP-4-dehydrorhamnose reductase [Alphaproteobacteria bacterium]
MKLFVVGVSGQLAHELQRACWPSGLTVQYAERPTLDLLRPDEAAAVVAAALPQLVVNAAAYTAVDAAESDRETAFAVNCDAPAALAAMCRTTGAALIHISTDYVFDGAKPAPYVEDDPVAPLSVYGASKAAGEAAVRQTLGRHVILRTSWLYSPVGHNFVKTMLRLGAERDRLRVVDDQHGSPTAAADLAAAITVICGGIAAGREDGFGTFHCCCDGATTWYGFAQAIFDDARRRGFKTPAAVEPIPSEAYPTPAARPRNSRLDCRKIASVWGFTAPRWQDSLAACLDRMTSTAPQPAAAEAALP